MKKRGFQVIGCLGTGPYRGTRAAAQGRRGFWPKARRLEEIAPPMPVYRPKEDPRIFVVEPAGEGDQI